MQPTFAYSIFPSPLSGRAWAGSGALSCRLVNIMALIKRSYSQQHTDIQRIM